MSLHYDWAMAFDLKLDTPQLIIDTLKYMTRSHDYDFPTPFDDIFFSGSSWRNMLQIEAGDTYSPGEVGSLFRQAYRYTKLGVDTYYYTLSFRTYMLDDGFYEEWWTFCEWIAPYSETIGCVGYYREVYDDLHPTLIYFKDAKVYICEVQQTPLDIREGKPMKLFL